MVTGMVGRSQASYRTDKVLQDAHDVSFRMASLVVEGGVVMG